MDNPNSSEPARRAEQVPYESPDIAWEEQIPPVTYGLTCAKLPGESDACNNKPSSKMS